MIASPFFLLLVAALGVGALLVLVMVLRIQAFVALLTVSLAVGLGAGMAPDKVLAAVKAGMGGTLSEVALVVGLGSMFGQMLESSGGAKRIASSLISGFGPSRAALALALAGFLIAVPTMFEVGFIVMVPLVFSMARQSKRPLLAFAMPLLAGLTAGHAFVPPTAAPVAVANILQADLGRVILYGALVGLPTALLVGPLYGRWISRLMPDVGQNTMAEVPEWEGPLPSFPLVLGLILFPIGLIVMKTLTQASGHALGAVSFIGSPPVALLLATFLSFYFLGVRRGLSAQQIQALANRSLHAAGLIMLVIGGGGAFKQVLVDSGIGRALASTVSGLGLSPLMMGFLLAAIVRISQGSTTVAMMTAAGLVSDLKCDPAQMVIALACGAVMFSHVNDAGFWLVKEYLGLTETQTLKSWTVLTTLLGGVALIMLLLVARLLPLVGL
jgi:Gnt-I system low-affinity gluconate transporter